MTDRALITLLSAIGVSLATIPATSGINPGLFKSVTLLLTGIVSRTIIQGANGFVPQQTYCHYHKSDPPLFCKTSVKVSDSPFQGDGDNNGY
jgi:hypothetical protein